MRVIKVIFLTLCVLFCYFMIISCDTKQIVSELVMMDSSSNNDTYQLEVEKEVVKVSEALLDITFCDEALHSLDLKKINLILGLAIPKAKSLEEIRNWLSMQTCVVKAEISDIIHPSQPPIFIVRVTLDIKEKSDVQVNILIKKVDSIYYFEDSEIFK